MGRSLHDHDGAVGQAHHLLGHASEQKVFQPGAAVRPHHDQVAAQLVQDFENVFGTGPVGNDYLMLDANSGVIRQNVLKTVPQVCRFPCSRIGQEPAGLRDHGRRAGYVEEDHFGAKRSGQRVGHTECLVGVRGKIGWNKDLVNRVHGCLFPLFLRRRLRESTCR